MKSLNRNLLVLLFAIATLPLTAQKFDSLDKSPADIAAYPSGYQNSNKMVKVVYSRPQLKGREVASLARTGKVWRTGANESAEITFYQDVQFGGQAVAKGTYSLFTIPGEGKWTVILNKNLNQWGAYTYDKDADLVRVESTVGSGGKNLEAFSIAFKKDGDNATEMVMGWGKLRVSTNILF